MTQHHSRSTPDEGLYEVHRELIDEIVAATARRQHLDASAASEFRSFVWERLLASDLLARHEGRCSLRTFLTVVLGNLYRDFRNQRWGKWRHSAPARRLGPVARALEMLMSRDGFTFDEAVNIITMNHRVEVSRDELDDISRQLSLRPRRRFVGDEALSAIAVPDDALQRIDAAERRARAEHVRTALRVAVAGLPAGQDRLILKLLFEDGFTVTQVAAALSIDRKALYRRRDRLFGTLREHLEAAGIHRDDIHQLLAEPDRAEDE